MTDKKRTLIFIVKTVLLFVFFFIVNILNSTFAATIGSEMTNSAAISQMEINAASSYGIVLYSHIQNYLPIISVVIIFLVYINDIVFVINKTLED